MTLAAWLPALAALGQVAEQPTVDLTKGLLPAYTPEGMKALNEAALTNFAVVLKLPMPANNARPVLEFGPAQGERFSLATSEGNKLTLSVKGQSYQATLPAAAGSATIGINIQRDPRQALCGLWIDGVEHLSFNLAPGTLKMGDGPLRLPGGDAGALALRFYNRALSRPEIIALADQPQPSVHTIALLGSTEAVLMAESGWLDAYLALKSATAPDGKRTVLRNLAWEGDTVWRQDRPLNFGPMQQQLDRVQAQQVVLMFGRQECLERGEAGLADFRQALDALVAACPPGALLMGCLPFNETPPPQRDLSQLNPVLARYDEVIKAVAEAHRGKFFDTAKSCRKQEQAWTRDGATLNANGQWLLADITAFALGWLGQNPAEADLARLRTLAQAKEALWHRYWRPANWAFLYGDRTAQPSSRDHLNPNIRWFPQELEHYRTLIDAKENELWKLSQELGRKLP